MKHVKVVLALLLALSLGLGMTSALAEDGLTTVTVLGYNQGSALMGSFENSLCLRMAAGTDDRAGH